VPMPSSACLKIVSHMCMWDQRGRFKDSKGRGGANSLDSRAVDWQHGTGVRRGKFLSLLVRQLSQVRVFYI
jgi:hypothetical protein